MPGEQASCLLIRSPIKVRKGPVRFSNTDRVLGPNGGPSDDELGLLGRWYH